MLQQSLDIRPRKKRRGGRGSFQYGEAPDSYPDFPLLRLANRELDDTTDVGVFLCFQKSEVELYLLALEIENEL